MPVFFNETSLDDTQRSRYESCVAEYHRIQQKNAELEKKYLRSIGQLTPRMVAEIDNKAKYHQPSNKSALFWRLLQGKPALKSIPPTSFSYPWYQIVEENGTFEVMVSWKKSQQLFGFSFLPKKNQTILINHALWSIEKLNTAASKLLLLDHTSTQEEIKNILFQKPEFIVQFRDPQNYRLHIGRKIIYGRRDTVLQEHYSLDTGGGNPIVLEIVNRGEDAIKENKSLRFNFLKADYNYQQNGYDNILSHTLHTMGTVPPDPKQWDWLKVEVDGWKLEKI
jgi:hypothetical protein